MMNTYLMGVLPSTPGSALDRCSCPEGVSDGVEPSAGTSAHPVAATAASSIDGTTEMERCEPIRRLLIVRALSCCRRLAVNEMSSGRASRASSAAISWLREARERRYGTPGESDAARHHFSAPEIWPASNQQHDDRMGHALPDRRP